METQEDGEAPVPVRALVVEDEGSAARVLSRVLAAEGCQVLVARSAEEALTYDEDLGFDIICTNITLPGMTGLRAIVRALRAARHEKASDQAVSSP